MRLTRELLMQYTFAISLILIFLFLRKQFFYVRTTALRQIDKTPLSILDGVAVVYIDLFFFLPQQQDHNNKTTTTSQPSLSNWSIKSNQRYFQPTYLRRRRRRYKTLIIQFSIIFLVKISTRLLITLIKFYVNQVTFEATKQIGFLNRKQY